MNTLAQTKESIPQERPIIFAGSFDPWTNGHLSVISDYLTVFPSGKIIILVAINPTKKYTFSPEERKFFIENTLPPEIKQQIQVEVYDGIIANYAYENNCAGILKGVRNGEDFNYETTIAEANSYFSGKVKTLLLPQLEGSKSKISSSVTKAIADYGGDTRELIPPFVRESLRLKKKGQLLIGVTGGTGCGKSTLSKELENFSKTNSLPITHIDVDAIVYKMYQKPTNALMNTVRQQMITLFGPEIIAADETVNRKILGNIVFSESDKKQALEHILGGAFLHELRREIHEQKQEGILLLDWALFAEYKQTSLCDENMILVNVPKEKQSERIRQRDNLSEQEIQLRMQNQISEAQRKELIIRNQEPHFDRIFLEVDGESRDIPSLYKKLVSEYQKRRKIVR